MTLNNFCSAYEFSDNAGSVFVYISIVWWCSSNVNFSVVQEYVWSMYVVCINTVPDAIFISAMVSKITVLTVFI